MEELWNMEAWRNDWVQILSALRSNLLDQVEFNISFWYLLKHSRFSLAPSLIPKTETIKQCLDSLTTRFSLAVQSPPSSTPDQQGRALCPSLIWIHMFQTPYSCLLGELAPLDALSPFCCWNNVIFVVSAFSIFLKLKKEGTKKYHVWTIYFPRIFKLFKGVICKPRAPRPSFI